MTREDGVCMYMQYDDTYSLGLIRFGLGSAWTEMDQ